jgi:hypothetical protein
MVNLHLALGGSFEAAGAQVRDSDASEVMQ